MSSPRNQQIGASFSLHRCSELGLDKQAVLKAAISELGLRRFRLMSYWNIHEPSPGNYDFQELDWQLELLARYGAQASLCLGKRQPRWPECHMPQWAMELTKQDWYAALMRYIEIVVRRYHRHPALASWQLENEALLRHFGYCPDGDYSRQRLKAECALVKKLDPDHPLIMTLSDSWGLPWHRPKPDSYAMSLYRQTLSNGQIKRSTRSPGFYRARGLLITLFKNRHTFIHELQAEPWTQGAITETPPAEQLRLMPPNILRENIAFARLSGLQPIDLWGLEWWYWLRDTHDSPGIWQAAYEATAEHPQGATARGGLKR